MVKEKDGDLVRELYWVMYNAKDEEGFFMQNIYPYAESLDDAANKTLNFVSSQEYTDVSILELSKIEKIENVEELLVVDWFDGYIQAIKFSYDEEDI